MGLGYNRDMIARLTGKIVDKVGDTLIVEVGGLGYEVFVTAADWGAAKVGSTATYQIYEQIREDAYNLYGFAEAEAKQLFIQLIGISGIGPKVALAVLSAASLEQLKQAIVAGDPDLLRGVSGVGKKTAERIVMELRGKVEALAGASVSSGDAAYQALVGLGYTGQQAADAVAQIPTDIKGDQDRIKAALKGLSK